MDESYASINSSEMELDKSGHALRQEKPAEAEVSWLKAQLLAVRNREAHHREVEKDVAATIAKVERRRTEAAQAHTGVDIQADEAAVLQNAARDDAEGRGRPTS